MPSLFTLPKVVSLPFAKLTFSRTGTATLQDTYTDADLQVAHTNPVVADAAGVFEPIYLDPTLPDYRVKLTTTADVLIYQVDDVPSNQNVQQSMRLESTNPNLFLYDTDGTSGSRKYRIRAAGNAFEVQAANDAESVFTTILQFVGGVLYSNATEVAVTASGTFEGTLSGMTASTTGTVSYRRVNNVVCLWIDSGISGTSNATTMALGELPASLIPTLVKKVPTASITDNGTLGNTGTATITVLGTVIFGLSNVSGSRVLDTGAFTNSGAKGLDNGWAIVYPLS
jgi:hypothetical protein